MLLVDTRFVTSAPNVEALPETGIPEIAVIGRSNVGKSSLLNRWIGRKRLARTSRTPGRTQLLNLFSVTGAGIQYGVVDLPGYGFADAPKNARAGWMEMIEEYLSQRQELILVLHLFDIRRGVEDEDAEIFRWAGEAREGAVLAVATKLDKLPKAKQKPAVAAIAKRLELPVARVLGTSSSTGQGVEALVTEIRAAVRGAAPQGPRQPVERPPG